MKFEDLKSPEELLKFIENNIENGYIGKNNKHKYYLNDKNYDSDWLNEYYLQSPEELIGNKIGLCWDKVELERFWFENNNYKCKTIFICFDLTKKISFPTHAFLVYKNNNKWFWFEESWYDYKGTTEYDTLKELIKDVIEKYYINTKKEFNIKNNLKKHLQYSIYNKPKFGINPIDFCTNALKIKEIM